MSALQPEWMPIEDLFARLSGLDDHAKRVIEHRLGPEIQWSTFDSLKRLLTSKKGQNSRDRGKFEWYLGHDEFGIFPDEQYDDEDWSDWDSYSHPKVSRLAELLLSATYISE
jgi:hypothetical protein